MDTKYSKEALCDSKRFKKYQDLLRVILADKEYTIPQVEKIITKTLKQEVR